TVQHLVAADLTLAVLRKRTQFGNENDKAWNDLERSLGEAMKELRTFSYLMHPQALSGRGLYLALHHHAAGVSDRSGLGVKLRADPKIDRLEIGVQRSLLRIVQEGLADVYRHASASHVTVELRHIGNRLHVIIADNGRGKESELRRQRHRARTGVG